MLVPISQGSAPNILGFACRSACHDLLYIDFKTFRDTSQNHHTGVSLPGFHTA